MQAAATIAASELLLPPLTSAGNPLRLCSDPSASIWHGIGAGERLQWISP
jgi:hypothetical protein